MSPEVAKLLARYIERRERDGVRLDVRELCRDRPELTEGLAQELAEQLEHYEALESALAPKSSKSQSPKSLPAFDGFRTVERLGGGGMGDVYKLQDLQLGRTVAAKVLRPDTAVHRAYGDFLREAQSLALFQDPGIVQIHE